MEDYTCTTYESTSEVLPEVLRKYFRTFVLCTYCSSDYKKTSALTTYVVLYNERTFVHVLYV
jgi:translation initiation factor 2 beta subunit (eIF-2beta)/eIF-5